MYTTVLILLSVCSVLTNVTAYSAPAFMTAALALYLKNTVHPHIHLLRIHCADCSNRSKHVELLHQECSDVTVTRSIGVTLSDWCVFLMQVGLNQVWIGIVFGILAGSYVLFAIPSGKLSDKFVSPTHSK